MIFPPDLIAMGYENNAILQEVNKRSYIEHSDFIEPVYPWADIRGVFEYVSCIEYAKYRLISIPKGELLSDCFLTPARYDSASLVFFAQAALDNLSVWLNKTFELGLNGNNISLYKKKIKPKLANYNANFSTVLDKYSGFIEKLNLYRMEWLHRVAGGANFYSDQSPSNPDANIAICVPIDPALPSLVSEPQRYIERLQLVQSENMGEWLISIDEFAIMIHKNTIELIIELLEVSLMVKSSPPLNM